MGEVTVTYRIDGGRLAAELAMTFIQLAQDEWTMFSCDPYIRTHKRRYERLQVQDCLASVCRGIKNKMLNSGRKQEDYDAFLAVIADNADSIEDDLQKVHEEFLANITQTFRYEVQKPFVYATMAYVFIYAANDTLENILHSKKKSPALQHAMRLIDYVPTAYHMEAWKPVSDTIQPEWVKTLVDKVVDKVMSKIAFESVENPQGNKLPK